MSGQVALQGGPQQAGYELELPTQTLKTLLPVLVASVAVLKAVLQVYMTSDALVQSLLGSLPSLDDLADSLGSHGDSSGDAEAVFSAVQEGDLEQLFQLVQRCEAGKEKGAGAPLSGWEPKCPGLVKASAGSGVQGESCWVLPQYTQVFEQHGDKARDVLKQQQIKQQQVKQQQVKQQQQQPAV